MSNLSLPIGPVSFYWRMATSYQSGNVVPDFLPFEFSFNERLQLIVQKENQEVINSLHKIYQEEFNVGYLQEGHSLAEKYGNDFMRFIKESIALAECKVNRVTEIGCGAGYLLNSLKQEGYSVTGIDPSPIARKKGMEYGFEVIQDFYPTEQISSASELIFHYDVLEHIVDPVQFLESHKQHLDEDGCVAFAVPDCTSYIADGDISMILHEHINYFDEESLRLTVEAAGYRVLLLQKSQYGGVLFCAASPMKSTSAPHNLYRGLEQEKFQTFARKYDYMLNNLKDYMEAVINKPGCSLGFYVPLRAIPYLSVLNYRQGVRFFDDDPGIHRKYFDGFNIAVENFDDLKRVPTTHIIIASSVFGNVIGSRIRNQISEDIEIKNILDFTREQG